MSDVLNMIQSILFSAFRMGVPLAFAALGGIYSSRAGIVAMGLEGMMLTGAFSATYVTYLTNNPWFGLLGGMIAGMLLAMFEGILIVRYKLNQVIGGVGINLLALGGTNLLMQMVWDNRGKSPLVPTIGKVNIPGLGSVSVLLILLIVLAIASWFLIYKTAWGLRLRVIGENPQAARSLGIKTNQIQYTAMAVCGMLSGLAGSYMCIDQLDFFSRNVTAGRGYIAMSIDILGRYHPLGILAGGVLFGAADASQVALQRFNISGQLLKMIPYLVTLLVIVFAVKHVKAPASLGKNMNEE
jgi:simple sugar transport system permease protein